MEHKTTIKIEVTFDNGEVWLVDVTDQIWERAKYYTDKDLEDGAISISGYAKNLQEEFDASARDLLEIQDYISNNVDWSEIRHKATLLKNDNTNYDYDEKFINAQKKVVKDN